jgi:hypothetical protein
MTIQADERDIRARAHAIWEKRGKPDGTAEEDWSTAEQQLKAELDAVSSPLEPLAEKAADTLEESDAIGRKASPSRQQDPLDTPDKADKRPRTRG